MKRILSAGLGLILVALPAWGQTPEQKKAAVAYLQKLQQKDGGFAPDAVGDEIQPAARPTPPSAPSSTSAATCRTRRPAPTS